LEHGREGRQSEALECVDANFARALHAFDARGPSVAVGDELGRWQWEILANEQHARRGEHTGAELFAPCFEREWVVAVFDEVRRIFVVGERRRLNRRGLFGRRRIRGRWGRGRTAARHGGQ
jgi:hypothetical protein